MTDGILDFLVMVMVLGVVLSSSFKMTMPLVKEINQLKYDEIYDKTASNLAGEQSNEYEGDGCMSYDEIILTVMSQSYFMPTPRVMDICGNFLSIKADLPEEKDPAMPPLSPAITGAVEFVPGNVDIGNWTKQKMDEWHKASIFRDTSINDLRFCIKYTLGDTEKEEDNCYALFILYQSAGENEPTLHRCLANGQIK